MLLNKFKNIPIQQKFARKNNLVFRRAKIMKKTCLIVGIALASLLILGFAGISFGQEFFVKDGVKTIEGPGYVPMEIVVKFKPGVSSEVVREINQKHGTSVIKTSRFAGFKRLRIPKGRTVEQMVAIYKKNPNVEYAEPNFIAHAFEAPDDEHYYYQWHLDNTLRWTGKIDDPDRELVADNSGGDNGGGINVEPAWDISTGTGVIVAVIDTGVAYKDHEEFVDLPGPSWRDYWITYKPAPDLAGTSFVDGYDFVNDDTHPNDDEGHGTHVTGTIAQSTNNNLGVAGVAYNCSIMPIKVLDSAGSGTYFDIAEGIYFAANNGAQVINMSLGGPVPSTTLGDALAYAYSEKDVTIVCASGNDGSATTVSYPAAYDAYCIAVGATRYDEEVSYYSNGGPSLDLTAPGGDTSVDQNGDGYGDGVLQQTHDGSDYTNFSYWFYQGTSMASPHVAGVAALLIANGVIGSDNVREALQSTAEDKGVTGWDPAYGWGIVDAAAALGYSAVPNTQPVANAGGPYSGDEDDPITFDGSGSSDPDGDSLTYAWDFGDGSTGAGVTTTHAYTAGDTYNVTLVVNDGKVDSLPDTTTATITEVNDPPVADAGGPYTGTVGVAITFDGSGSYDIDDGIASYDWDFGDGSTGVGAIVTHAYDAEGTYTVTLTVTDVGGSTGTDTTIVTVTAGVTESIMRVADIAMSIKTAGINVNAIAKVTILDANDAPVAGATVSGNWSGLTGDTDSNITDSDGIVSLSSDKVKNAAGTFTFTVTDVSLTGWEYDSDANAETSDSITVP